MKRRITFGGLSDLSPRLDSLSAALFDSAWIWAEVYLRTGRSTGVSDTYFRRASQAYFSEAVSHRNTKAWCFFIAGFVGS